MDRVTRYRPVKVTITKKLRDQLSILVKGGNIDECIEAVDHILRKVEEGQSAKDESNGPSFREVLSWMPAGCVTTPTHGRANVSIAKFCRMVGDLGATQEDFNRFDWRKLQGFTLEKFTGFLPGLLTEARGAANSNNSWRPPTFNEVVEESQS